MVDSDEEAAWTMVNKISNLIERAEAAEAERDEARNQIAIVKAHLNGRCEHLMARAVAAEAERDELERLRKPLIVALAQADAEVARLREALRLIASGGCAIPSMKCIPGMSCSACIARDALAAPTKEDA